MNFQLIVPLVKATAVGGQSGYLFPPVDLRGIASDQRADVDGQIVKAASSRQALDYLGRCGAFNWDHTAEVIGKIHKARVMGQDEARKAYGTDTVGDCVEVEGRLSGIRDERHANISPGLVAAHRLVQGEHPLFFSIQGSGIVRPRGADGLQEVVPTIIPEVAITPHPINVGTVCQYAKSFGEMLRMLMGENARSEDAVSDQAEAGGLTKSLFFFGSPPKGLEDNGYPTVGPDVFPTIQDAFGNVLSSPHAEVKDVTEQADGKKPGTETYTIQVSAPPGGTSVDSGTPEVKITPVGAVLHILTMLGSMTPANAPLAQSGIGVAAGPAAIKVMSARGK